jgi:hypothetical protein
VSTDPQPVGDHFVYQYLDVNGRTMYIGYGESPSRAMSHTGGSHNPGLRSWLESGVFELRIAGPYRDEAEALAVEAALISAMAPQFNVHPGTGPKFRPLGVPAHLGDRPSLPPLTEEELGRVTGGALLVYIAPLKVMKDERPKVDPTNPDDEVIALDVEAWWEIDRHIASWKSAPELGPQVLVGVYGRPRHRFVIGAFSIDTASWGLSPVANKQGVKWRVPLADRTSPDAAGLRGRRLDGVRFGRARWEHYRWIDADGVVRYPATAG